MEKQELEEELEESGVSEEDSDDEGEEHEMAEDICIFAAVDGACCEPAATP